MASKDGVLATVSVHDLANVIRSRVDKVLVIDSRSFMEYNDYHVSGAVNVCCSKLVKRRLQQEKVSMKDFLVHSCHIDVDDSSDVIVYDQASVCFTTVAADSFLHVLLQKLVHVFPRVFLLSGGFLKFQACYRDLCEDKSRRCAALTSLSQPCLPITNVGPTRILPFLYLGSQQDANNKELLKDHNITYEVNVSTNCPKPDFIQDSHFLRLPVNDNYGEKLLPYFVKATQFIDKVREANGCVLVHCLAGISRSPTVAIAYVMRHLKMTFDDAFRYVKSKRATISPNFNFLGQLLEYERQLRAEEVLDSSVGDVSTAPVQSQSRRCTLAAVGNQAGVPRSTSLSLSLSMKSPLETVPSSPDQQSPAEEQGHNLPRGSDMSPTSAMARLTFANMESSEQQHQQEEHKDGGHSVYVLSQRKHAESYIHHQRYMRMREQRLTMESRSHMILTVSKRVMSQSVPSLSRARWRPPSSPAEENRSPGSHCAEISVRIEEAAELPNEEDVEIRRKPSTLLQRPHSDSFRNRRRPCFIRGEPSLLNHGDSSETASILSEDLYPPTPSTPPPHGLLCPQGWTYARSDSVTTSGLGSEVSDTDTRADDALSSCGSVRFGCPSEETESLPPDDGVFTENSSLAGSVRISSPPPQIRSRPRPSSLLGIVPAKDIEWMPPTESPSAARFSLHLPEELRRPRPTSLTSPLRNTGRLEENESAATAVKMDCVESPSVEHPDSASVFRLWRQREAALDMDRQPPEALYTRRRSKEFIARYSEKRKSSEIPEEADSDQKQQSPAAPAAAAASRQRGRDDDDDKKEPVKASDHVEGKDGLLYRVRSCPGIAAAKNEEGAEKMAQIHLELQLSENQQETRVRLRVRSQQQTNQTQRYSCGSLDQKVSDVASSSRSPFGSRHSSNPSLTHASGVFGSSGFSVIQVS